MNWSAIHNLAGCKPYNDQDGSPQRNATQDSQSSDHYRNHTADDEQCCPRREVAAAGEKGKIVPYNHEVDSHAQDGQANELRM